MEFSPFLRGHRLRAPMVRPVAMVGREGGDLTHRPLKLATLVTRHLARLLDRPTSPELLRAAVLPLPASLRMDIFRGILANNDRVRSRPAAKEQLFHAWLALFADTALELEEFLGDHWSHLVFVHMVEEELTLPTLTSLTLASREVNQERLCFLFELTESTWKPQLRVFLSRLPLLTRLTLRDFCDDDTVSIVGRHCPLLTHLTISLGPESFSEQQLSDEGFADLIEAQLEAPSLREVDISDCFTSAVTAKTVLNFAKLASVTRLHVMWSHFIWLDLSIRFLGAEFEQNRFVKLLSIKFGHDNYENSRYFSTEQGAINFIAKVFPALEELRLLNMFELETREEVESLRQTFGGIIKHVSVQKCRELATVAAMVPDVERLELGIVMNPTAAAIAFPRLTHLTVTKDLFAIDFGFIHDLLANCTSIEVFKVFSLKLANCREERLVELVRTKPHLRGLRHLVLHFRTYSALTSATLHALALHCPLLEHVGNLLSWELAGVDEALLASLGRRLVLASKSHWSLPWRSEDGQYHDVEANQGCVMDLYDNR